MSPATAQVAPSTSTYQPSTRPLRRPGPPLQPEDLNLGELFSLTREAILVGNLETNTIVLWNPAAERLFGYTPAQAIGQPISMLMPPALARLHNAALAQYRRGGGGAIIGADAPIDVPAITRAGEEIRVQLALVPLQAGHGRFVLAMLRDSADRRRADLQSLETARAKSAQADAETALRNVGDLLRNGVRNLERPLARLQRSAARLRSAAARPDRVAKLACVVERRVDALREAIELLSDRAALESGHVQLEPQRVNLVPLLTRVVVAARGRAPAHKLVPAMPQGLTVVGDPLRIEQILTNLIDYAIRRSPRGTWVDIELRRPLAGLARLEIRDYGRPVDTADREHLLDRGTSDSELFVCRGLLEQHGGTLSAEHPKEGGLRLIATLPAQRGGSRQALEG